MNTATSTLSSYIVVVPARNAARRIEIAIQSQVPQRARPFRWVVVSDADGTDAQRKETVSGEMRAFIRPEQMQPLKRRPAAGGVAKQAWHRPAQGA
jgi:hypothetical protein